MSHSFYKVTPIQLGAEVHGIDLKKNVPDEGKCNLYEIILNINYYHLWYWFLIGFIFIYKNYSEIYVNFIHYSINR